MPAEILTDNVLAFCSLTFLAFIDEWGIQMRFRCAYVPESNGIVERCHSTVKRIAVMLRCLIVEAMYWYIATPKDNEMPSSMPANGIYQYQQHVEGIDPKLSLPKVRSNVYQVGELVWVKPPNSQCTTRERE